MSHEAILYGAIIGATRKSGDGFFLLHTLNVEVINSLPTDDDHPWVDKSIFALPGDHPHGTFRRQVIHFGLSMKDDPNNLDGLMSTWIDKFEGVLRQLYWMSVRLHLDRDFDGCIDYEWNATEEARVKFLTDPPEPTCDWTREIKKAERKKLYGT